MLAVIAPGLLVAPAPLTDWPNHLARLWLVAGGAARAPLDAIYALDWSGGWTNIALDLLAAAIGEPARVEDLGRAIVAAACLLTPLGALLLSRAAFGGWFPWQAGFGLLAWNATLAAGFLSFQLSVGLALALGAAWLRARALSRPGAAVLAAAGTALLYVVHVFGAAFLVAIVAGCAFGAEAPRPGDGAAWLRAARRVAAACLAPAAGLLGVMLLSPGLPGNHAPAGVYSPLADYGLWNKVLATTAGFGTYALVLDYGFMVAAWAIARLLARGPLKVHAGLFGLGLALLVASMVMPPTLGGTAHVDWRPSAMAVPLVFAAIMPCYPGRAAWRRAVVLLLALSLSRTAITGAAWAARAADREAVRAALQQVPPGARLLPVVLEGTLEEPPFGRLVHATMWSATHLPALAIPWRQAFVPILFAARGKQPVRVLPPFDALAATEGTPAPVSMLANRAPSPRADYFFGHLRDWQAGFDYILVMGADRREARQQPGILDGHAVLHDGGFAMLLRVTPPAGAPPASPPTPRP